MSYELPKGTWWGTFGSGGSGKSYWSGLLQVQGTEPHTKSAQTKGRFAGSPTWEAQGVSASGAAGCRGCAAVSFRLWLYLVFFCTEVLFRGRQGGRRQLQTRGIPGER